MVRAALSALHVNTKLPSADAVVRAPPSARCDNAFMAVATSSACCCSCFWKKSCCCCCCSCC